MDPRKRPFSLAADPKLRLLNAVHTNRTTKKAPPTCGAVARSRAQRFLATRRLPVGLWPVVAAVILISIVFDRQIQPFTWRAFPLSGSTGRKRPSAVVSARASDPERLPAETGSALHGQVVLRHTPPADFPLQEAAQVLAFLIRNRGKLDNEVVRQKWRHLDRISLPLAVYLRDVEARDEWSVIEKEAFCSPLAPELASVHFGKRCSLRHRRLLDAAQEWQRRGEELMTLIEPGEAATAEDNDALAPEEDVDLPKP